MGQIVIREAISVITDLQLDKITDAFTDELHVSGTVGKRVVDKIAQGVLQSLRVRRDGALIGYDSDHPALELGTAAAAPFTPSHSGSR